MFSRAAIPYGEQLAVRQRDDRRVIVHPFHGKDEFRLVG